MPGADLRHLDPCSERWRAANESQENSPIGRLGKGLAVNGGYKRGVLRKRLKPSSTSSKTSPAVAHCTLLLGRGKKIQVHGQRARSRRERRRQVKNGLLEVIWRRSVRGSDQKTQAERRGSPYLSLPETEMRSPVTQRID